MRLLRFRTAKFYEGPACAARTENQSVFRVRVRNRDRTVKEAWLTFGRRLDPLSAPDEPIDVRWD